MYLAIIGKKDFLSKSLRFYKLSLNKLSVNRPYHTSVENNKNVDIKFSAHDTFL